MSRSVIVIALAALAVIDADARREEPPAPVEPHIVVEWVPPSRPGGVPEDHAAWMRDVMIAAVDRELRLPRTLMVRYRDCGAANAHYYAGEHAIVICHELWDQRRALYRRTGHDRVRTAAWLRDAMAFTFFHELGHALHRELELPLVGRIEDAVDEIATMWLVRIGARGYEVGKHAAHGHHLRSLQPGHTHDFWDEHGSGAQRGFAIACLLHGADAKRVASLMKRMNVPAARLAKCAHDHALRVQTWQRLLGPHLRGERGAARAGAQLEPDRGTAR